MQLWGTLYDHSPAVNKEKDMLINIQNYRHFSQINFIFSGHCDNDT